MATFKAYYGVDFDDFALNFYKNNLDSHELSIDSTDPTNAGSDDRYSIWTTDFAKWAIAFHGSDFGYDGSMKWANEGTVEAFSEWFYNENPDDAAGEEFGATRIYLLKGINIDLLDFISAIKTNSKVDDRALLETIFSGDDIIKMSDFDDRAYGYEGNDIMRGYDGEDLLYGDGGDDTLYGGQDADKLNGGDGNDVINGDKGADHLKGNDGNDFLRGGKGYDRLNGHDGDDILRGEKGNDVLIGGAGSDTFQFWTGHDSDKITDFEAGDIVDLSQLDSVADWNDLTTVHMSQDGNNVVIDGENGDILTLKNVDMGTLSESDFIFQEPVII